LLSIPLTIDKSLYVLNNNVNLCFQTWIMFHHFFSFPFGCKTFQAFSPYQLWLGVTAPWSLSFSCALLLSRLSHAHIPTCLRLSLSLALLPWSFVGICAQTAQRVPELIWGCFSCLFWEKNFECFPGVWTDGASGTECRGNGREERA
jgi:hypothetical protein